MFGLKRKKKNVFGTEQVDARSLMIRIHTLDEMRRSGLIVIDYDSEKVFISMLLAASFLADSQRWRGFLSNVQAWYLYDVSCKATAEYLRRVEIEAVRERMKEKPDLSDSEMRFIRQQARMKVPMEEIELPAPKPVEFVLCSSLTDADRVEVLAIGRCEGDKLEMVSFEEVEAAVTKENELS